MYLRYAPATLMRSRQGFDLPNIELHRRAASYTVSSQGFLRSLRIAAAKLDQHIYPSRCLFSAVPDFSVQVFQPIPRGPDKLLDYLFCQL
ncbi:MAG: hypothetical protein AAF959_08265 [Cyanobacteria bacterium P01_D01_bin.56]